MKGQNLFWSSLWGQLRIGLQFRQGHREVDDMTHHTLYRYSPSSWSQQSLNRFYMSENHQCQMPVEFYTWRCLADYSLALVPILGLPPNSDILYVILLAYLFLACFLLVTKSKRIRIYQVKNNLKILLEEKIATTWYAELRLDQLESKHILKASAKNFNHGFLGRITPACGHI